MSGTFDRELFADRMVAARRDADMSQAALAEAVDVSTETISRIERGAYEASLASAAGIATVLGVGLDYLTGIDEGDEQRNNPKSSPVAAKLSAKIADLSPSAQKALLRLVEHIPAVE